MAEKSKAKASTKPETKSEAKVSSKPEEKAKTKVNEAAEVKPQQKSTTAAKAGKRSAKSLKEAEVKLKKAEAKTDEAPVVKKTVKPPRSRLERRSKNYQKAYSQLDNNKFYSVNDAVKAIKTSSKVKFDASVELHVNLSVDPKQADQNIRGNLVLPGGSGKKLTVAVYSDDPTTAKNAGADIFSTEEISSALDKGHINFDILIASPKQMPNLAKYARLLGPRGLMPNPKSGTVTKDIEKAVKEAKAGRVEYRVDSYGIVHLAIGKVSFDDKLVIENIEAVMSSIKQNKPQSVKGSYIKSMYLTSSMGPSVKVDLASVN